MELKKQFITRWIKRDFNNILFKDLEFDIDWKPKANWQLLINTWLANDFLIKSMYGLDDNQLDELSETTYEEMLKKINEIKWPSL